MIEHLRAYGFLDKHTLDGIPTAAGSYPLDFVGDPELGWSGIGQSTDLVNPYAMLFGKVRTSLRKALERGVRVQFMVSTKSDGKAGDDVIGLEMRKLMKRGAEVYYYDDGFHHSKVMMVDSLFCTVGTTNLDARSLCFDYEVNAFIFSPRVTHELQQIFADDVRHSTLLTPEVWKQRFPLGRRIRSRFFTIAKRFM